MYDIQNACAHFNTVSCMLTFMQLPTIKPFHITIITYTECKHVASLEYTECKHACPIKVMVYTVCILSPTE